MFNVAFTMGGKWFHDKRSVYYGSERDPYSTERYLWGCWLAVMNASDRQSARAGRYVRQPTGYRA